MPHSRLYDIVSLGSIYLDINAFHFPVQNGFRAETETVGGAYETVVGGSAVNIVKVAASLGLQPAFIGKVGADFIGRQVTDLLHQTRIEPGLVIDTTVQTNVSVNYVGPDGSAVMTTIGTANQSLEPMQIMDRLRQLLPKTAFLYLGGFFKLVKLIPYYDEIIDLAHAASAKVILDHGRIVNTATTEQLQQLRDLALRVDYYFPSEDEFLTLWEAKSSEEGLEKLANQSSAIIAVKLGSRGAQAIKQGHHLASVSAHRVNIHNTVGAGDSFNAGFMAAQLAGKDLIESLKFANATAAVMISQPELPTNSQVQTMLSLAT